MAAHLSLALALSQAVRLFQVLGLLGVFVVLLANVGVDVAVFGKGVRGKRTTEDSGATQEASNQFAHQAWRKFFAPKVSPNFVIESSTPPQHPTHAVSFAGDGYLADAAAVA
jgi:hypothetical protein